MTTILLIGAGFSYNWGGWLASEAFDYMLGSPWLDEAGRALLWKYKREGFERALHELQKQGGGEPGTALHSMEQTVRLMFEDMNRGFGRTGFSMNFLSETGRNSILEFLAQFDVIFSLNQDLLLEIGYMPQLPQSLNHRWSGFELPGMEPIRTDSLATPVTPIAGGIWTGTWRPQAAPTTSTNSHKQPIYKLHGSSNWISADNKNMLIMGGDKTDAIAGSKVLSMYIAEFRRILSRPRTRIMIIGYGFRDKHINHELNEAAKIGHLRSFIIDPAGADAPNPYRDRPNRLITAEPEYPIQTALIGASRRPLNRIFGGDEIERDKVLKFFHS